MQEYEEALLFKEGRTGATVDGRRAVQEVRNADGGGGGGKEER